MNTTSNEKLVSSTLNYLYLEKTTIEDAKKKFSDYQSVGVIKENYAFDDNEWQTTDEYSNVGFHFRFNKFTYNNYKALFNIELDDFVLYLKAYLISLFGKNSLETIRNVLRDIIRILNVQPEDIYGVTEKINIYVPNLCSDFFASLPEASNISNIDELIDSIDSYSDVNLYNKNNNNAKRSLFDMDTYFKFDEIIRGYWKSDISEEERLFYYPLYLWWIVTAVIPLRPREFLLTERSCLKKNSKGEYLLTLRRNRLKGGSNIHEYKIVGDYSSDTYKIPNYLGEEINNYIKLTEKYEDTEINTLFIADTHYKKWGQKKHSDSRFLTYTNMNTILKYFYKEIIGEKYNYITVYENEATYLPDNQIGYIHLGDTRHIAMINLMQEGGTPMLAMFLAGHTNTEMASHYYTNVTRLIECKTYREYRRIASDNTKYEISNYSSLPQIGSFKKLSDGGRCYSSKYNNEEIDDCLKSMGDNGEIGYCPNCHYYRNNTISFFSSDDIYKKHIKDDCEALKEAINLIREEKGDVEDIGEALLKLKSSSKSYEAYLLEKQRRGL